MAAVARQQLPPGMEQRARLRVRRALARRAPESATGPSASLGSRSIPATPNLPMRIDVDMVDVLLGFYRLASRLAEDGAQFGGGLPPLCARETFGADDELARARI